MIITVSRRTDIPALYGEWFIARLKEKFVYTINPFNQQQVKSISLRKEDVTAFVFWSKNPKPFIKYLDELEGYSYYFQFTLTPYDKDLESHLPNKEELINTFVTLSEKIGKEKVIWRYDPIVLSNRYTIKKHVELFKKYCEKLSPYTEKVIISFVDQYVKNKETFRQLDIHELSEEDMVIVAKAFSKIAKQYGLAIETCAEEIALEEYGINHAKCIDDALISKITGKQLIYQKDTYQRGSCSCMISVDIGSYDTCVLGCAYCYAVKSQTVTLKNYKNHDPIRKTLIELEIDEDDVKEYKKDRTIFD